MEKRRQGEFDAYLSLCLPPLSSCLLPFYATHTADCAFSQASAIAKARDRSSIKSLTSSIPTERRTRSGGGASLSRNACGMLACDIRQGRLMVEPIEPKLTAMSKSCVASTTCRESATSPVVKLMTAPSPVD